MQPDARVLVAPDLSIVEATPAALDLLQMSLEQLRALPPGGLSVENDSEASRALETAWTEAGRSPMFGSGTIRLLDGRLIRVQYFVVAQPDGGLEIVFDRANDRLDAPPRIYAVGEVLAAWRAAERTLDQLEPGSEDWEEAQATITRFRDDYRRLVTERGGPKLVL